MNHSAHLENSPSKKSSSPKLRMGPQNDHFEQEADRIADQVVQRMPLSGAQPHGFRQAPLGIQRKCAACDAEEQVQRKPISASTTIQAKSEGGGNQNVNAKLSSQIQAAKGGGGALGGSALSKMNQGFGRDFSHIRIHNDQHAAQLSQQLNAKAFTLGNHVFFGQGQYQPESPSGQHLLAHELVHTLQQGGIGERIQRTAYGGAANPPANYAADVAAATTPALKVALMQRLVGSGVTISDKTTQSASDPSPDPAHLDPYTATSTVVNYDDNLNSKTARVGGRVLSSNAGYTFTSSGTNYVVLGPLALDSSNFQTTIQTLNHEFDHVRQNIEGSLLRGNSSELDAWTKSFIREFHHSYAIKQQGTSGNCFIDTYMVASPLRGYYASSSVTTQEKANTVSAISTYYNSVISPHTAHTKVFRFWIRRWMAATSNNQLPTDLNTALSLGIASNDPITDYRQFPCGTILTMTPVSSSTLASPTFPAPATAPAAPPTTP